MKRLLSATALAVFMAPTAAWAESVDVEGVAAVVKDDVAIARDRAIDDAKRKAVEQVAGAKVTAESLTENFQLVEDRIYSRASGFVRKYRILSERREEGVYHVRIRALVDSKTLVNDLSLILKARPRVITLIAEQNAGRSGFSYWWGAESFVSDMDIFQNALIQAWQPRGFKFVDPALLTDSLSVKGALRKPGLSNKAAVTIGRDVDADVAIVGKVLVTDGGPVMRGVDMRTFNAVGSLRVINVDTGEIIAVADETGTATHVDANVGGRSAIRDLAGRLSGALEQKIVLRWTSEAVNARSLEVVIAEVRSSKIVRKIKQAIQDEVRGVEAVKVRRRKGHQIYLTVDVRATAKDFGRDLEALRNDDFRLHLEGFSRSRLYLRVVP